MKKTLSLLAGVLTMALAFCAVAGDVPVKIADSTGAVIHENYLDQMSYDGATNQITLKLKNPIALGGPAVRVKIDGVEKPVSSVNIDLTLSLSSAPIQPVTPAPVPTPTPSPASRPTSSFPMLWAGPFPETADELLAHCTDNSTCGDWAAWVRAHPEDLGWMWLEYQKSNGGD